MALSNDDFRKLLSERKVEGSRKAGSGGGKRGGHQRGSERYRKQQEAKGDAKTDESDFRDRAAERRENKITDYKELNEQLGIDLNSQAGEMKLRAMTVEDSKFLGGDERSTHLVKGLDYALLRKQQEKATAEDKIKRAAAKEVQRLEQASVTFQSTQGKLIYEAQFKPKASAAKDAFLPRRSYFEFDMDPDLGSAVPTRFTRSKLDCPNQDSMVMGSMDLAVLEKMTKVLAYIRPSKRKVKRHEKDSFLKSVLGEDVVTVLPAKIPAGDAQAGRGGEPGPSKGPVDDDEDIFGDAGTEYECKPKDNTGMAAQPTAGSSAYFVTKDDLGDLPAPASAKEVPEEELGAMEGPARPPSEMEVDEPEAGPTAEEKEAEEKRKRMLRGLELREDDEAYAELEQNRQYAAFVESDDEDLAHMDAKDPEGLTRFDFDSEEAFEAYKTSKEQSKGPAFLGGNKPVSRKAARAVDAKGGEDRKRRQKMGQDLRKIEKLLQDQGKEHGNAFSKPPGGKAKGAQKAPQPAEALKEPAMRKKRRI